MNTLNKKFQIWHYSDGGYHLKEIDDLNELKNLLPDLYTNNYYVTQKVEFKIEVKDE